METTLKLDMDYVKWLLPDTYAVEASKQPGSIRCVSKKGFCKNGDSDDEERWACVVHALKKHFGLRFLEVDHNVCSCYKDFTIHLQSQELADLALPNSFKRQLA